MASNFKKRDAAIQRGFTPSNLVRFTSLVGRRGGSVVSASDLGPEGPEFEPWLVHPRCVLRQNT